MANTEKTTRKHRIIPALIILIIIAVTGIIGIIAMRNRSMKKMQVDGAIQSLHQELEQYHPSSHSIRHQAGMLTLDGESGIGEFSPEFSEEPAWVEQYYEAFNQPTTLLVENCIAVLVRTQDIPDDVRTEIWGIGYALFQHTEDYSETQLRTLQDALYWDCLNVMEGT